MLTNSHLLIALLIVALSHSSCTTVLKANFESDTLGSNPLKTLPGDPSGDEMTYISEIENRLEIVNWEGSKSLEIGNITPLDDPTFATTYTSFISRSSPFTRPVTYSWNGQLDSNNGRRLLINFSAGTGISGTMSAMKIEPNGAFSYSTDFINYTFIGTIELDQPHTFIVSFDKSTKLFSVSVFQSGENISTQGLPFISTSGPFPSPTKFRISFNFGETDNPPSIDLGHNYTIDNLAIAHKNP